MPSSVSTVVKEHVVGAPLLLQEAVMSVHVLWSVEDCHVTVGAGAPVAVAENVIVAPTAV
jgi:hypothetical protein